MVMTLLLSGCPDMILPTVIFEQLILSGFQLFFAQDQNSNYQGRLGTNPADLPTILAVMSEDCIETARNELGGEMGEEGAKEAE